MSSLKITAVETFVVQPWAWPLCIVRVQTNQPGLYGLGCASYKHRYHAVKAALDHHVAPFMIGKDPHNIEDLWQSGNVNGYWRNGPVLNAALGGIDMALWDIKGKVANLPCYQLWGGRSRAGVPVYVTAHGKSPEQVVENGRKFLDQGYHHLRCQLFCYEGMPLDERRKAEGAPPGLYFNQRERLVSVPKMFAVARRELGDAVELLHDAHERLAPIDAIWLAKALEPHRPFFLEDPLAPEDMGWLPQLRAQSATPIALGELFTNPAEYVPAVSNRWVDFIKVRPVRLGGITPTLKLLHLAESFGVRFCLHGPGDNSALGAAANVHLSTALHNHGILEWVFRPQTEADLFPGLPEARRGHVYVSEKPGLGVDFDESLAAKFPPKDEPTTDTITRLPDGSIWWP
jgi:mannonate dehydratase